MLSMYLAGLGRGQLELSRQTKFLKSAVTGVKCSPGAYRYFQLGRRQLLGAARGMVPCQGAYQRSTRPHGSHLHTPSPSPSWAWRPKTSRCPRLGREAGSAGPRQPEARSPPGHKSVTLPVLKPLLFLKGKVETRNSRQISDIL